MLFVRRMGAQATTPSNMPFREVKTLGSKVAYNNNIHLIVLIRISVQRCVATVDDLIVCIIYISRVFIINDVFKLFGMLIKI